MAVLLLAVCLISQLRLAGRERQRRAAQQNSVEQLLAAAPEGILCMRGTVETRSTTEGEHVGRIARTGSREEWDLAATGCTGAWRGLYHKKE